MTIGISVDVASEDDSVEDASYQEGTWKSEL